MNWREHAAPIIARVIFEHRGESDQQIRAALLEAYPYGERRYWPYKVWCSEVRIQLRIEAKARGARRYREQVNAGQLELLPDQSGRETPAIGVDSAGVLW